jgi:hypothetical protein
LVSQLRWFCVCFSMSNIFSPFQLSSSIFKLLLSIDIPEQE